MNKIILVIKGNSAFIQEVCTKNDIAAKTSGVNDKRRVFANNHIAVEFREPDFV